MKLVPLDPKFRRWDTYREFHMGVGQNSIRQSDRHNLSSFVQFETGEVVCNLTSPNPGFRGEYPLLNLAVYSTSDEKCPKLFLRNGTPVAKAWLEPRGQQILLLDRCTTRAVALRPPSEKDATDHLPERFVTKINYTGRAPARLPKFSAYFAGEGRDPQGPVIAVVPPLNISLTPDEFAHIKEITQACKAWYAMTEHETKKMYAGAVDHKLLLDAKTIADLEPARRCILAENGVARKTMYEPYLVF